MIDLSKTVLGIELGSTRIKAVLIDEKHIPVAAGVHEWSDHLENGIWTYFDEEIRLGLQSCVRDLKRDLKETHGLTLETTGAIGISAMMHGYLPFDKDGRQLCSFRTWKNTITGDAAARLTDLFGFNIPQRWSIAHLYQAILNGEDHVKDIAFLTTLAGYLHWQLTGEKVIGIGDASGMFPIDSARLDYREDMLAQFKELAGIDLTQILPKVLPAGANAGRLTEAGSLLLDPEGDLRAGIPFAPCEGDAGTGMTATNSVKVYTGNVSAGTSDFAMLVVDREPGVHREIDMVTTPSGDPVAMVHCNNCTSDLNAWVDLLHEAASLAGASVEKNDMYPLLFKKALEGDADCGGLLDYNYIAGEGVTDLNEGRPLFTRRPDAAFNLANFMRAQLLSALATLKIGLDILTQTEHLEIRKLCGHGGFFKTPGVGARLLSAAAGAPVQTMETAGEGGPYGMALLGAFMLWRKDGESLPDYLERCVFSDAQVTEIMADKEDIEGFAAFLERYKKGLAIEEAAIRNL
ncbi:MAG: ATPase [Lachnospiraceae bacterium]|nr:ATPase [Lachnospiraceae bacterium]